MKNDENLAIKLGFYFDAPDEHIKYEKEFDETDWYEDEAYYMEEFFKSVVKCAGYCDRVVDGTTILAWKPKSSLEYSDLFPGQDIMVVVDNKIQIANFESKDMITIHDETYGKRNVADLIKYWYYMPDVPD